MTARRRRKKTFSILPEQRFPTRFLKIRDTYIHTYFSFKGIQSTALQFKENQSTPLQIDLNHHGRLIGSKSLRFSSQELSVVYLCWAAPLNLLFRPPFLSICSMARLVCCVCVRGMLRSILIDSFGLIIVPQRNCWTETKNEPILSPPSDSFRLIVVPRCQFWT